MSNHGNPLALLELPRRWNARDLARVQSPDSQPVALGNHGRRPLLAGQTPWPDPTPKCTRASPLSGVSSPGPLGRTGSEGQ